MYLRICGVGELLGNVNARIFLCHTKRGVQTFLDTFADIAGIVYGDNFGTVVFDQLAAFDRYRVGHDDDGTVTSYRAERMTLSGSYASCNVSREEIGMYADLDMVVLCNENTASAAEVFTATLRDYGMAEIVGETTFGKGIMQTTVPLSAYDSRYTGYVKMTTYAYVTECGETYHDVGIAPSDGYEVALSDEAQQYNFYFLPQALDDQLQKALTVFQNQN